MNGVQSQNLHQALVANDTSKQPQKRGEGTEKEQYLEVPLKDCYGQECHRVKILFYISEIL